VHLLLASNGPREETFDKLTGEFADPVGFLNDCWATGKITHRQLVAGFLKSCAATNPPWFAGAEPLVLAGANDADMSVRELALATLEISRNPRLFECAREQLNDPDPLVRRLGLEYLRKADPKKTLPIIVPLLDDPDLQLAAAAEVALMRWSGEDYGVRERLAIPPLEGPHPRVVDPAKIELVRQGIARRKNWWQVHAGDYVATGTNAASPPPLEANRPPIPNFTLSSLDGKTVRLSDFHGRIVLINFWATWCTACVAEIPDLIALQKERGDRVVILGVALDGVPDEHGHDPGAESADESHAGAPDPDAARKKVARTVAARGINYPVLLDASNTVGGEFNGGELPTTVIVDAEGRLRRRFIGERNLAVFEKMIKQVSGPSQSVASSSAPQPR
jgi:thiol-disulfide isomerase/thioredoxin